MAFGKRLMIEAIGTEFLDTIVAKAGRRLIPEESLSVIVDEANTKIKRNQERIARFFAAVQAWEKNAGLNAPKIPHADQA